MSLVGQKLQSVSPRWNSEVMCDRFIQQNQNEHRHSNNCTVLLQHTVMTTVTVLCHMSYVQTVNSIGKCDHGGLMVWPSERGADLRRPLNVTSQYTSQFVIFSALFYRTSCAMFCCFVTSETKCWRANFDNLCSVCLLHVWMVLNINSCFTAKWHCVWQFGRSVQLEQGVSVHILCNVAPFVVSHKLPTISEESNKTEIEGHCWWPQDHSKRPLPLTNRHGAIY